MVVDDSCLSIDSIYNGQSLGKLDRLEPLVLITAFHVVEHLPDPHKTLRELAGLLFSQGYLVFEVSNSMDALLKLYDCEAFQHFTYWSQNFYLFNATTLEMLVRQASLLVIAIQQFQRYPLSNHLYWLSLGKT